MSKRGEPKAPANPRVRSSLYGMAALYLVYLYYQIARPFLTRDPYGPTTFQFALGTALLGGGAVLLAVLAWKMYKTPVPEESEEDAALPEKSEEESFDEEDAGEDDCTKDGIPED